MTALYLRHFDALSFVKKLKELGASEEMAEYQVRQMEDVIDIAVSNIENRELASKSDIQETKGEIRKSELRLQKEIKALEIKLMTLYGGGFLIILGVLAKGFHWL